MVRITGFEPDVYAECIALSIELYPDTATLSQYFLVSYGFDRKERDDKEGNSEVFTHLSRLSTRLYAVPNNASFYLILNYVSIYYVFKNNPMRCKPHSGIFNGEHYVIKSRHNL